MILSNDIIRSKLTSFKLMIGLGKFCKITNLNFKIALIKELIGIYVKNVSDPLIFRTKNFKKKS